VLSARSAVDAGQAVTSTITRWVGETGIGFPTLVGNGRAF
jgi:hypothetical protein